MATLLLKYKCILPRLLELEQASTVLLVKYGFKVKIVQRGKKYNETVLYVYRLCDSRLRAVCNVLQSWYTVFGCR